MTTTRDTILVMRNILIVLAILVMIFLMAGKLFAREVIDSTQAIKCILGESRGEPYEGQIAVAEVLRRNPKIPFYGAFKIKREINGKWYALEKDKWVKLSMKTVNNAYEAWKESEHSNYSRGATNFEGDSFKQPYWAKDMKAVAHIGNQTFYKGE